MLDAFTPAQLHTLGRAAERWTRLGRSAGPITPADRQTAAAAVRQAYTAAGLAPPATLIWMRSPLSGVLAAALLESVAHRDLRLGERIGALVTTRVWVETYERARNTMARHVETPVWRALVNQTLSVVGRRLQEVGQPIIEAAAADLSSPRVVSTLWPPLTRQLRDQLHDHFDPPGFVAFDRRLLYPLWDAPDPDDLADDFDDFGVVVDITTLGDRTRRWQWQRGGWLSSVRGERPAPIARASRAYTDYVPGGLAADWAAFTDAGARLAIPGAADMAPLNQIAAVAGIWWPFEHLAVLTERPTQLRLDEQGRLHADGGPAVTYADGWHLHRWHGQAVPPQLVTAPLNWTNWRTERDRRWQQVIAERIGYQRLLAEAPDRIKVASDQYGTLWHIPSPPSRWIFNEEPSDEIVVVEVLNSTPEPDGSIRRYVLRVPPEYRQDGSTPRDAIGWTFGLADGEYGPAVMT